MFVVLILGMIFCLRRLRLFSVLVIGMFVNGGHRSGIVSFVFL